MMLRDEAMEDEDSSNGGVFNPMNNAVYAFSYQNPIKYVDPDGECPLCVVVLLAGFSVLDAPTQNVTANQIAKQEATDLRNRMLLSTVTGGTSGAIAQGISEVGTTDLARPGRGVMHKGQQKPNTAETPNTNKVIKGHTKHGLNQSISRNGGKGVNVKAKLDAVKNPTKISNQSGGRTKYTGKKATVILNEEGKVITTFGSSRTSSPSLPQGRPTGGGKAQRRNQERTGTSYNPNMIK